MITYLSIPKLFRLNCFPENRNFPLLHQRAFVECASAYANTSTQLHTHRRCFGRTRASELSDGIGLAVYYCNLLCCKVFYYRDKKKQGLKMNVVPGTASLLEELDSKFYILYFPML